MAQNRDFLSTPLKWPGPLKSWFGELVTRYRKLCKKNGEFLVFGIVLDAQRELEAPLWICFRSRIIFLKNIFLEVFVVAELFFSMVGKPAPG